VTFGGGLDELAEVVVDSGRFLQSGLGSGGGARMAIMLPDGLAYALNLVGIPWPNIDEDELRHCAGDLAEFAGR